MLLLPLKVLLGLVLAARRRHRKTNALHQFLVGGDLDALVLSHGRFLMKSILAGTNGKQLGKFPCLVAV
jgi:hypothetical protein